MFLRFLLPTEAPIQLLQQVVQAVGLISCDLLLLVDGLFPSSAPALATTAATSITTKHQQHQKRHPPGELETTLHKKTLKKTLNRLSTSLLTSQQKCNSVKKSLNKKATLSKLSQQRGNSLNTPCRICARRAFWPRQTLVSPRSKSISRSSVS